MAISLNGGGWGSRRRGGGTLSEINITPFVDVVLVLLVIFMLTAHVMEYGMEIQVPQVRYVQSTTQELPVVAIDKTGESALGTEKVNIYNLAAEIRKRYPSAKGVYVQADRDTVWDPIAQVISELGEGKLNVYIVTEPMDAPKKRR